MSGFASLQGQLLIASPALADPNFRRTVVVITEHTAESAMGLVLNRPLAVAAREAVPVLAHVVGDDDPVFEGGPVQPGAVVALATFSDPERSAGMAFADVGYVRADGDPDELAAAVGTVRVYSGYSGWGPGQLDAELAEEAWITLPAEHGDVFGQPDSLWARCLERKGGRYRLLARIPDDLRVN